MVKKPRAQRSAPPRKPVIIEADAQPTKPAATSSEAKGADPTPPKSEPTQGTPQAAPQAAPQTAPKASNEGFGRASASSSSGAAASTTANISDGTSGSKPPVKSPPPPPSSGGNGAIKGGLIGAGLMLLGALGLNYTGLLPGGSSADNSAFSGLEARVDALSNTTATVSEFDPAKVQPLIDAALQNQAQQFEAQIAALAGNNTGEAAPTIDLTPMSEQITALEAEIASLKTALSAGSGGESEGLSMLSARLDGTDASLTSIKDQIATLSETVTATQNSDETAQLSAKITEIEAAFEANKAESASALADLSASLTSKLTLASDQIEALAIKAADTSRQADVAAAIATAGLKAAIDRGGPFMAELETYARVEPDAEIIGQLRPFAASGVPTRQTLISRFDAVAYDMIATESAPAAGEGGLMSSLMSSAKSLVKVRPIGSVEGDSIGAITARMGDQLLAGNYAAVQQEFAALPDAAKAAGSAFMADLEARSQADDLIRNVLNQALADSAAPKAE